MSLYIGIDTSNYTTSFALCGDLDRNVRKILDVKQGERGVRQSDGVFMHLKQAPELYSKLVKGIDLSEVKAVGVSISPRAVEGSYMPVFVAGTAFAHICAQTLGVPLFSFSHQDGHIMAGLSSCGVFWDSFFSVHLSGGTFEILKTEYDGITFKNTIVGGTKDISAGQLIDRVGVACGMKFPCGKEVSDLAEHAAEKMLRLSVSEKDGYVNFSGAETQALRKAGQVDTPELCFAVLRCIGESIIRCLKSVNASKVLFVGGVASSSYLRKFLNDNKGSFEFIFASAEMSTDNAWGIAKLAQRRSEYGAKNCNCQPDKWLH